MELQYRFPISERPFCEIGERINMSEGEVIKLTRELKARKVIKFLGCVLNTKSTAYSHVALVGAEINERSLENAIRILNNCAQVSHNYLREHEKYNIWFTYKAKSREELCDEINRLMNKCGAKDYVILPTRKVYKLSVKYDLNKGISRSNILPPKKDPPPLSEYNLPIQLVKELAKNLPVVSKPFHKLAEKYNIEANNLLQTVNEMIKCGLIRDFGAFLNPISIGFKENAMIYLQVNPDDASRICELISENFEEVTHCIEREIVPEKWEFPVYFVVHAISRDKIEQVVRRVTNFVRVKKYVALYSIRNLKEERTVTI